MSDPNQPPAPRRPGFRFSIATMMLITLVVAIGSAGLGGMLRKGTDRSIFVLFSALAPVAMLVAIGVGMAVVRWVKRRRG